MNGNNWRRFHVVVDTLYNFFILYLEGEWTSQLLGEISRELRHSQVSFTVIAQVAKHYLVRLVYGSNDIALALISRGLMRHTSLTTQEAVLLSMMPQTARLQTPVVQQQKIATFKASSLQPGKEYEVYVSFVADGPCHFYVQLKQSEELLAKLMKEINSMDLTPMEEVPLPGTVCLARCLDDGHICRAVVTNDVDGSFKVGLMKDAEECGKYLTGCHLSGLLRGFR